MGRISRDLFFLTVGHMIFIIVCIGSFQLFKVPLILFMPLVFSILLVAIIPPRLSIGVALAYVTFDGMIKILSGYHPLSHVGADVLVVLLGLRSLIEYAISPPDRNWALPPFLMVFFVHLGWLTVQILNPYGISVFAGLAAYKVYFTFILLYFLAYLFLKNANDLRSLMWLAVVILAVQAVSSIYQFEKGESSLVAFSLNYSRALGTRFLGQSFRPFGTTAVPGGSSTWIFLTFPLMLALFFDSKSILRRGAIVALFAIGLYVLFICQVRAAIIKGVVSFLAFAVIVSWRRPEKLLGSIAILAGIIFLSTKFLEFEDPKFQIAKGRLGSIAELQTVQNARGWNTDSFLHLWENAPLGIGLSRVGAAGAYFQTDISKDKYYGSHWSFADNLYLTLAIELGFPGMIFFLTMLFGPFLVVFYRTIRAVEDRAGVRILVAGCLGMLFASIVGHYGSEGSLYLPECAYYWLFLGAAVRFSEKFEYDEA